MVLGIAEDFTSNVTLDSQLYATPGSGLYLNSGVHPSITVENLLSFLPITDFDISLYDQNKTYTSYQKSRNKKDLVRVSPTEFIYQSLQDNNLNKVPGSEPSFWLLTNIESLRLKAFVDKVKDRVYADLNLTRRLVNNQNIYEVGRYERMLPNNYCGWVFEPKGSDYVTFRINQAFIQKSGTTPVNVYVINQGQLIDTLVLTPSNGRAVFEPLNYTFSGIGPFYFVIDSTTVFSNNGYLDSLKYDGFVVYTTVGIGSDPETATYSTGYTGNGLGFNITAYLDSSVYIDNNIDEFGNFLRAAFEYETFLMYLHNSNNRSNRAQRIQIGDDLLLAETKDLTADTVVSRYHKEKAKAIKQLQRTFDTQLDNSNEIEISIGSL